MKVIKMCNRCVMFLIKNIKIYELLYTDWVGIDNLKKDTQRNVQNMLTY